MFDSIHRVAVVGLGVSGFEAAKCLVEKGVQVFVNDERENEVLHARKEILESLGVRIELGRHTMDEILAQDLIIMSPGIAPKNKVHHKVLYSGKPVWSEIELAWRLSPSRHVVGVTGTNGKTTVTTLIGDLLRSEGREVVVCGNIGRPFVSVLKEVTEKTMVVLELSSFQLHSTLSLRPHVALLLNVTDDHVDWHGSFEAYFQAKLRIASNQRADDHIILNWKDEALRSLPDELRAQVHWFNQSPSEVNANLEAVLAVADVYEIPRERAAEHLLAHPPIEHRLERLPTEAPWVVINDSKSTNPASLEWALKQIPGPIILLAGGRNKGNQFEYLGGLLSEKVKRAILFGEAGEELQEAWKPFADCQVRPTLREAIPLALEEAASLGEVSEGAQPTVLLSPGCASFDEFKNFEERGVVFKESVRACLEAVRAS